MPTSSGPSVEQLREQSEQSREALASTVTELRARVGDTASELKTLVSPAHIKQEIRDYIRHEREDFATSVQRTVKDNPLQAAAVGAAIVYPAWSLLRAIPTPLLLIGAGLFFTSKKGRQTAQDAKTRIDEAVKQGTERLADAAGEIKSDLQDRIEGERYRAEEVIDNVTSTAGGVTDRARAAFHDATDAVKKSAGSVSAQTVAVRDSLVGQATDGTAAVKDRVSAAGAQTANTITSFVNDNALLVAGIGAAIGAFIAASIPSSQAENRLFGAGSEKIKDKAREAAARGIEQAGEIAAEAAGAAATAAAREGLDASGVQRTLHSVADSVRAVADRGLDTALGATSMPNNEPVIERNPS